MKRISKFLIVLVFISLYADKIIAQTIILEETFLTQESFNTFTPVSVSGDQHWYFNESYGAVCSGYESFQSFENEDWLISPGMDLSSVNDVKLTFQHTRGTAGVMNVGVEEGWYKVFAASDYTGDPTTTQWIELEGLNQALPGAWQYIFSGELVIPASAKSENSHIAFRYISSSTQSATWEIKNLLITGESIPIEDNNTFKIMTWNVEHFGCVGNAPYDDELQMNNVASVILSLNPDIICLQEVTQSYDYPTINSLISILGNEWGGDIAAGYSFDCSQNQGVIYKKSKVRYESSYLLSSGNSSHGNTYYYNWAGGRYPALYNFNLIVGSELIPVSIVNIHAKAMADEDSYIRRKGASEGLKAILDDNQYNTKKLIIIGDFNDYLIGSSCSSCGNSPYENFVNDNGNYMGLSQNLQDNGCVYYPSTIDNIIISNELFENYVANSTMQETALMQSVSDYCSTTSDHLPVSALLRFSASIGIEDNSYFKNENILQIYPNPVIDELKIDVSPSFNNQDANFAARAPQLAPAR